MNSPEMESGPTPKRSRVARAIPTALTLIRLMLGLGFPWIPQRWRLAALLVAGATEFLDGYLARLFGTSSLTGQVLDPIADKVFVIVLLITFVNEGSLGLGEAALVMSRDIIVMAGSLWVAVRHGLPAVRRLTPALLGKLATTGQLLMLLVLTVTAHANPLLTFVVGVLSLAAGIDYVRRFR